MMRFRAIVVLVLFGCSLCAGCSPLAIGQKGTNSPLLKPLQLGDDAVNIEVYFARLPQDDAEQNAALWTEIDEQQLPSNLRRQWEANGLRAGFVGGQLPAKLSDILEQGQNAPTDGKLKPTDPRPPVSKRLIQLQSGLLNEIVSSPSVASLPLVLNEDGQIRGKTYEDAQCQFMFKAYSQGNGKVRLEMTPQILHGEAKPRYVGEDGVFRLDASKPKQTFESLLLETHLAQGQLMVLGHVHDKPGSLGYHFFTEDNNGRRETKLILLRIGSHQRDDLFSSEPKAEQKTASE